MPLNASDHFTHFDRLLRELPQPCGSVEPPLSDDVFIESAALSFREVANSSLSNRELAFLESQRDGADVEFGTKWQIFKGFALGNILARYKVGELSDLEFDHSLALLPGFMFLHGPTFIEA